jgi:UDP:flavonoid glycosyltransferase YjiC (YdhE family)
MNSFHYGLPENITAQAKPGAKILFACMAADGHFNPLTGLALHLKEQGYDVRWYVGNAYADKLRKMNIPHFPQQKALDLTIDNVDEFFPERNTLKSGIAKLKFDLVHFFIERAPDFYADLKEVHTQFPFELMVADITFTAIPFVKEKMNIPVVGIGIMPIAEDSKDLAPMGLGMTPSTSVFGRLKQAALRYITNDILLREPLKLLDRLLAEEGLERDGNLFDTNYRKSTIVLQSGTPSFEYKRSDLNKNIRFVGPLLPASAAKTKTEWYHSKMASYKKIILVTQGTAEPDVEKLIVPTLEAFKDTEHLVVVTTAGSKTAELRLRFPHDNIIIEDFIPFAGIMPLADVYVSNGGYGGVMLGIQHRLPMVVAGVNEGKNEICARVGYFKLGINLKTEKPKPEQLKTAVEAVLADGSYKAAVSVLCNEFSHYNPQELCAQYVAQLLQQRKPKRSFVRIDEHAEIY